MKRTLVTLLMIITFSAHAITKQEKKMLLQAAHDKSIHESAFDDEVIYNSTMNVIIAWNTRKAFVDNHSIATTVVKYVSTNEFESYEIITDSSNPLRALQTASAPQEPKIIFRLKQKITQFERDMKAKE